MDHLPYPEDSELPPLEIPYICGAILTIGKPSSEHSGDFPSFIAFAKQVPCATQHWQDCDIDNAPVEAQASVFFGLLADFLGTSFKVGDFVRISSASMERVITLANLENKIRAACRGIDVGKAKDMSLRAAYHAEQLRTKSPLANRIALSVEILSWSLVTILASEDGIKINFGPASKYDALPERMLAAGWCSYWTRHLCDTYSAPLIIYLTGLPSRMHSGHENCSTWECKGNNVDMTGGEYVTKHATAGCHCSFRGPDMEKISSIVEKGDVPLVRLWETPDGDIGMDVAEAGFGRPFIAISHVWSGGLGNPRGNSLPMCQLKFLYAGAKRCGKKEYGKGIFGITHQQDIVWKQTKYYKALLRILGEDELKDRRSEPLESYLEVADRWALHGANEDSNSLYIWFDTLCIPVSEDAKTRELKTKAKDLMKKVDKLEGNTDELERKASELEGNAKEREKRAKELQEKAINKMAFVYATAMHVLVIDQTLRDVVFDQTSDTELAALFLTSPWMSRSWTFQEACLARQFSFLLKDNLVDPRQWFFNAPRDRSGSVFEWALKFTCICSVNAMPDITNKSVNPIIEEQQSTFVTVWNQLSRRNTSKPRDLHGILAVMLGLSAYEILKVDENRRILGILRSQHTLPLSMILFPHPEKTTIAEGCEWVSRYPSGAISGRFGAMIWETDGFTFLPSETKSRVFKITVNGNLPKDFLILTPRCSDDPASKEVLPLRVELLLPNGKSPGNPKNATVFLLLHAFMNATSESNFRLAGTCFTPQGSDGSENRLCLSFICPLSYSFSPNDSYQNQVAKEKSSEEAELEVFIAEAIGPDTVCLLMCDPEAWPTPRYRRPEARILQKSLSRPAITLILVFWGLFMGAVFFDPSSTDWAFSLYTALEAPFDIFPHWLRRLNIPLKVTGWAFQYPRVACPLLLIFTRVTAFLMLEYPRLELIAQRIRYERYAETFNFVATTELPSRHHRFRKEWLYQYQPRWRLCLPIAIATSNLVSATWPQARRFLLYLPYSPKVDPRFLSVIGTATLIETTLRIVGEAVWRYFGLDTASVDREEARRSKLPTITSQDTPPGSPILRRN